MVYFLYTLARVAKSLHMKKKNTFRKTGSLRATVSDLAEIQLKSASLPPLSAVEKAKLDHSLAIEQLYYSSKVEGTNLTDAMIDRAIHGRRLSAS